MPKINVYLPIELAAAVRDAQLPVSGICQAALERAVRDVSSARGVDEAPTEELPRRGLFARFTPRARKAITLAEKRARDLSHSYVGTEHALLGILDEGNNVAIKVLVSLEIELDDLRAELAASMGPAAEEIEGRLPFTPLAKRALELTTKEALSFGHNYVGCEHVLLGLIATQDGLASQVLRRMGLELRTTRAAVVTALSGLLHTQEAGSARGPVASDTLEQILHRLDAIEARLAS